MNKETPRFILLYTMTSGLGDYLIMGDVMRKVERILPEAECLMVHRKNPHVQLWPHGKPEEKFFNIYSLKEIIHLITRLRKAKKQGVTILGLQMAPGSLQGYFWYSFLKKLKALDYIVDFNLINADIITTPEGDYILDWQLNQLKKLLHVEIPAEFYQLNLPIKMEMPLSSTSQFRIGIHPWSRRGQFPCYVWSFENWEKIIRFLLKNFPADIVIFGRDNRFDDFKKFILAEHPEDSTRIQFLQSASVPDLVATIQTLNLLISVNTAVPHIGHALRKDMIILNGPTLSPWIPKGPNVINIFDTQARWPSIDRYIADENFPSVGRINPADIELALVKLLNKNS